MAKLREGEQMVRVEQLRPGVFIRLVGLPWYRHPFLMSSFRIKDFSQIETLQALDVKVVACIPAKSLVQPLEIKSQINLSPEPGKVAVPDVAEDLFSEKKKRIAVLKEKKDSITRADKKYSVSLHQIKDLMYSIERGNSQFMDQARQFSNELSRYFLQDSESIMHVLNMSTEKGSTLYYHSLNVTVLSLILGRVLGLTEKEMSAVALGALFHDMGKSKIEKKILRKRGKLTKSEWNLLCRHPFHGVEILSCCDCFPPDSMAVVYEHHERCDGGGYPRGLKGAELSTLSKIVSIANLYDNLINKIDTEKSLTPYQALSYMFSRCASRFEKEHLSAFIQSMGIYPPGTIVVLNGEYLGMVISVNLGKPLYPSIVLYDPQVPKKEALIIDLDQEPDYAITDSVNPARLAPEIAEYLSPCSRMIYFVDPESGGKKPE